MPLDNINLDAPGHLACEPVSFDLNAAIQKSIDTNGLNNTAEHVAIGLKMGHDRSHVMQVINDCVTDLI